MYNKGKNGQDCPFGTTVKTKSECKLAASELNIQFSHRLPIPRSKVLPAGCHYRPSFQVAYVNEIIDPLHTSPIRNSAGICKGIAI